MAFVVLYDANVLYPSTLRDLLVSIAQDGLAQAKWTDHILDETFRNLKAKRPDLDPDRLDRTREVMMRAVRDCMIKGYEPLIEALELPDPDDRHVLAAAIRAKAQLIVTFNLKDFPRDALSAWDVEAKHPDAFIEDQINLDPAAVYAAVRRIADRWRNPPGTVEDVLGSLERDGMVAAAAALRAL
ncbi:PIN domain-containing protein [Streptomyces sp. CNQ085]|uniref:PIN domain-containing protein n=1 Tax=Streptomyces sp. CNQ085 TaxID=2886944 RepID=UPI001F511728|nr:PIN domain-containing protein [Streptomyces sp. CNQ085]MCI0384182.1 PIN domain-containing protein [Streptomyces sp. CNQ085]